MQLSKAFFVVLLAAPIPAAADVHCFPPNIPLCLDFARQPKSDGAINRCANTMREYQAEHLAFFKCIDAELTDNIEFYRRRIADIEAEKSRLLANVSLLESTAEMSRQDEDKRFSKVMRYWLCIQQKDNKFCHRDFPVIDLSGDTPSDK